MGLRVGEGILEPLIGVRPSIIGFGYGDTIARHMLRNVFISELRVLPNMGPESGYASYGSLSRLQ